MRRRTPLGGALLSPDTTGCAFGGRKHHSGGMEGGVEGGKVSGEWPPWMGECVLGRCFACLCRQRYCRVREARTGGTQRVCFTLDEIAATRSSVDLVHTAVEFTVGAPHKDIQQLD